MDWAGFRSVTTSSIGYPNRFLDIETGNTGSYYLLRNQPYTVSAHGQDSFGAFYGYSPLNAPLYYAGVGFSSTLSGSGSFSKTFTLPSNAASYAGATIEVSAAGVYTTPAAANGHIQFFVNFDGTNAVNAGLMALPTTATTSANGIWSFSVPITVYNTGTTGVFPAGGQVTMRGATPVSDAFAASGNTFNMAGSHTISIQVFFDTYTSQTIQLQGMNVRVLYPGTAN